MILVDTSANNFTRYTCPPTQEYTPHPLPLYRLPVVQMSGLYENYPIPRFSGEYENIILESELKYQKRQHIRHGKHVKLLTSKTPYRIFQDSARCRCPPEQHRKRPSAYCENLILPTLVSRYPRLNNTFDLVDFPHHESPFKELSRRIKQVFKKKKSVTSDSKTVVPGNCYDQHRLPLDCSPNCFGVEDFIFTKL